MDRVVPAVVHTGRFCSYFVPKKKLHWGTWDIHSGARNSGLFNGLINESERTWRLARDYYFEMILNGD